MDLHFTVDLECWPGDDWVVTPDIMGEAYARHILGRTPQGAFGLPFQLEMFKAHDLAAIFFVEPFFAMASDPGLLSETIGLLQQYGQEIQLHLHPEWANQGPHPLLPGPTIPHLKALPRAEQQRLILAGLRLLARQGVTGVNALRAGNFGANVDTLRAAAACGLTVDSSYDLAALGKACALSATPPLHQPALLEGLLEVPLTCYEERPGRFRHVQLTACSFDEMTTLMEQAAEKGYAAFTLLSHGFELLDAHKRRPQRLVIRRFEKLCRYLADNRHWLHPRGFSRLGGLAGAGPVEALRGRPGQVLARQVEQGLCRFL